MNLNTVVVSGLLPAQSQAGHQHSEHDAHDGEDLDGMWKGLTALGGVYLMFLIEHFLTLGKMYKERKKKVRREVGGQHGRSRRAQTERRPASVSVKGAEMRSVVCRRRRTRQTWKSPWP